MAGRQKEKEAPDEVRQNTILREVYVKERDTQKLYTQYHVNPFSKVHLITRKPMSWHDNLEEPVDGRFLDLMHHATQQPKMKYPETQTESQEYGWDSEPLVNPERQDHRLNHFQVYKDITLYKAKMWSLGEDDRHK
ncbi:protein FAM183A-like [Otolemur garnettii]|uniref:Cilia and flagella associated protein 144 n=1 Tax=Otolemur garnettii TaxID=30611 RepID=H0X217_OTOGA|nr:protein FAM183A-like [Otolemur garnettii]